MRSIRLSGSFVTWNDMRLLRSLAVPALAGLALSVALSAHPMGNLSVNHYARLEPGSKGVDVTYVLDLAEIPTFELTQTWGVPKDAAKVTFVEGHHPVQAFAANCADHAFAEHVRLRRSHRRLENRQPHCCDRAINPSE